VGDYELDFGYTAQTERGARNKKLGKMGRPK
jgi:hypothetical protein